MSSRKTLWAVPLAEPRSPSAQGVADPVNRLPAILVAALVVAACSDAATPSPAGTSGAARGETPSALSSPPPATGPSADPVELPSAEPNSADLIDAAVAAGTIDAATGLLYRIYATFGDPRLPATYSTGAAAEDVIALMEAGAQIDTLPPDIAAEIRPYLLRPTDQSSPFNPARTASTGARTISYRPPAAVSITTAATCDEALGWAYADAANWLRVWAPCGSPDVSAIPQVIAVADAMYNDEKAYLGGKTPLEDEGGVNQGWETRVDIYLVASCVPRSAAGGAVATAGDEQCLGIDDGLTVASSPFSGPAGAKATSSFLLINRGIVGDPNKFRATMAHELFHAFENAYNHTGFFGSTGVKWIMEASATWAEWKFANAVPMSAAGPIFRQFQRAKISLQDDAFANGYVSFGWPLFLEQERAGSVRVVWEQIEGEAGNSIMGAIDSVLPFEENFRVFAMRGWNKDLGIGFPVTPLLDAPPVSSGGGRIQPAGVKSPGPIELQGTEKGATPRTLPGASPSLWAHYQHFTVKDDVGRVVLDFSGIQPADRLDVDALVRLKGETDWERRELPDGKTTWCTDDAKDGIEEFVIVLSNHASQLADTLTGTWTYDSPKEPCLSYHIRIEWTDTWNNNSDTVVFDGYADTINRDALGGQVMLTGDGYYDGDRDGYLACNPGLEGLLPSVSRGGAKFQAVIVGDKVTVNAYADVMSDFSGVTTWPMEVPRTGTYDRKAGADKPVATGQPDPAQGTVCTHAWYGKWTVQIQLRPPP